MKQKTLREDAHSREAETCRKRPRSARECAKAHSFSLYRKDRLRRSFELKMPAGRRATQIDDLGIKKDKNLPH